MDDVLLDLTMPSSYNEQEVPQRFVGKGLAGFVQKPYRLWELQKVIIGIYGGGG